MANEIRLRRNNISGAITDNPLTVGATTINSPGFVDLPVVDSTNHLVLILDPLEVAGAAEIVRVTAHSASASSLTVVRGAEGSSPRQHAATTTWFHGPVASDTSLSDVTSGTRPSVPYEGELIYETDTNKLMGFGGTDWASRDAGGQVAYAQAVANQGAITAEVDLTNCTVTLTPATGRRYKITGYCQASSTGAADQFAMKILQDGTQITDISGGNAGATANQGSTMFGAVVLTPTASSHTYKLSLRRVTGAGTVTMGAAATAPAYILVEDIGAA